MEGDVWFKYANLNAALFEGLKATRQSYEAGLLSYEAARRDTEQKQKAFYGLLLQEGSLAISKETCKRPKAKPKWKQTKNGLVSELQYLQVQLV